MKAADFDYVRPASVAAAVAALADETGHPQILAGGQSLLAMMNLRVAAPDLLIDITRLDGFRTATETNDAVTFGAGVTHAAIEDGRVPDPSRGLMPSVAANIAYRAVRNRGTLGGSLALADPAADWPTVMAALDATLLLSGAGGERSVAAASFVTGIYETLREPDEVITRIVVPKLSASARFGYRKFARKSGEFAHSIGLVLRDEDRDVAQVWLGAASGPPLRLAGASDALRAGVGGVAAFEDAVATDLAESDRDFDGYSAGLHLATLSRAFEAYRANLGGGS